jgi:peptide/nickel transport system ATP-binding protein
VSYQDAEHIGGEPLLQVRDLCMSARLPDNRQVQVLDKVNLQVAKGEAVGLIGESGSGKSMTALSILRLQPQNVTISGEISFDGTDMLGLPEAQLRSYRGGRVSMVFQDPMSALDPVFTIGHQMTQVLRAHRKISRRSARDEAVEMLEAVGISDAPSRLSAYPYQLSGGMQQRIVIAMALACGSSLLIADEPTTAVDITIQAQLLDLLRTLNQERGLAVLFISHDIGVIAEFCDRVAIMYGGQVVETGSVDELLESPRHPYTSGLIRAIPSIENRGTRLEAIPGRVPPEWDSITGCRFHPRCKHALPSCRDHKQKLTVVDEPSARRLVRCERASELSLPGATT